MRSQTGRRAPVGAADAARSSGRPVLLATLDVPVTGEATALAVDSAVESGQPLLVVNVVEASFMALRVSARPRDAIVFPDVEESLRQPAELGASLGVQVERLRVLAPRSIDALVELVLEREAALVVFGADPDRLRKRVYARTLARLHERTSCLVWP